MRKLAIISASGGLDSTTVLYKALNSDERVDIITVSFQYKQKHSIEKYAFQRIMQEIKNNKFKGNHIKHIDLDLDKFMSSTLDSIADLRNNGDIKDKTDLEFYMPFRNLVFASISAMIAESIAIPNNYESIYIGLGIHKHTDINYSKDYWDITVDFADALAELFALNDSIETLVYAPYANKYKNRIVEDALSMNVPISKTWTCYDPKITQVSKNVLLYEACNECEACKERGMYGKDLNIDNINKTDLYVIINDDKSINNQLTEKINKSNNQLTIDDMQKIYDKELHESNISTDSTD